LVLQLKINYKNRDMIEKYNPPTMLERKQKKWNWKMNYCKENNIPPAQNWAWRRAGQAFESSKS